MKYANQICSVLVVAGLLATLPACNDKSEENKANPAAEVKQEEAKQEEAKQEEAKKEEKITIKEVTQEEKKALGLTDDLEDSIGLSAMGIDPTIPYTFTKRFEEEGPIGLHAMGINPGKPSSFTNKFEEEGPIGLSAMGIDPAGPEAKNGKIAQLCDAFKKACKWVWMEE